MTNSASVKDTSPMIESARRISGGSQTQLVTSPDRPSLAGSPRSHPPQTPELPPASSFDFPRPIDGNISPSASVPRSSMYPQTPSSTSPELYSQRNSTYPPLPDASSSTYPPIPDMAQWQAISQQRRPPTEPPTTDPQRPVPPTKVDLPLPTENNQYPGLSQQRPLPANFPPPMPGHAPPPIDPQMGPTWQHHHYYPPANPPSYPHTQERYICPTCSKPFSRPSSLKIHTYSHTGEKPYKCKHEGCGKHFSVRSNMKRHEKGCHGGETASTRGSSPKTT
jgi:uncharacterized Zn-finger protein